MLSKNELISLIISKVNESDIHKRFPFDRNGIELNGFDSFLKLNLASNSYINRSTVLDIYSSEKNNPIDKFLLAMLWGGIRKNNLIAILEYNQLELNDKLIKINELLKKNNIEYFIQVYLKNKDIHINGVGLSFITKHLYFKNSSELFIYDKWTKRFHAAYLKSTNLEKLELFFLNYNSFNLKGQNDDLIIRRGYEGIAYKDFCFALKDIFKIINENLSRKKQFKSIGHLESYLFGEGGRNKYDNDNPRVWLFDFIKQF